MPGGVLSQRGVYEGGEVPLKNACAGASCSRRRGRATKPRNRSRHSTLCVRRSASPTPKPGLDRPCNVGAEPAYHPCLVSCDVKQTQAAISAYGSGGRNGMGPALPLQSDGSVKSCSLTRWAGSQRLAVHPHGLRRLRLRHTREQKGQRQLTAGCRNISRAPSRMAMSRLAKPRRVNAGSCELDRQPHAVLRQPGETERGHISGHRWIRPESDFTTGRIRRATVDNGSSCGKGRHDLRLCRLPRRCRP